MDILDATRLPEVLKTGKAQIGDLQQVGEVIIATNRVPIIVDGKIKGAVATFQDVTQIQKMERKIRRELHQKGLIAKYNFNDITYSQVMKDTIAKAQNMLIDETTVLILEKQQAKELCA